MICTDCIAAKETECCWPQYNALQCAYCAARLIWRIGTYRSRPPAEIAARKREVMDAAVKWGHTEKHIRELMELKHLALQPKVDVRKQLSKK